jgi:DNA-binding FadR family transcriptional regulator
MTAADEPFGALLAPITLRTAGERIAERLVTAIALGEFVPGQRLPAERDLAAMLEVSRTTVREALQRLQAAGYVTARRGRGGGTFVQTGQGADSDEMIRRTLLPA